MLIALLADGGTSGMRSALSAGRKGFANRVGICGSMSYQFVVPAVKGPPRRLQAIMVKKLAGLLLPPAGNPRRPQNCDATASHTASSKTVLMFTFPGSRKRESLLNGAQ